MKRFFVVCVILFVVSPVLYADGLTYPCTDNYKPVFFTFNNYYPFPARLIVSRSFLMGNTIALQNQIVPPRVDALNPGFLKTATDISSICVIGSWVYNNKAELTLDINDVTNTQHIGRFLLNGDMFVYGTVWCSGTSVVDDSNSTLKLNYDPKRDCYEDFYGVHMTINFGSLEDMEEIPNVSFILQNQLAMPLSLTILSPYSVDWNPYLGMYFPVPPATIAARNTATASYFAPYLFSAEVKHQVAYKIGDSAYACIINYIINAPDKCTAETTIINHGMPAASAPFTCKVADGESSCKLLITFASKEPKRYQLSLINATGEDKKLAHPLNLFAGYDGRDSGGKYLRQPASEIKVGATETLQYDFHDVHFNELPPGNFISAETDLMLACKQGNLDNGAPCVAYGIDEKATCIYSFQYDAQRGQCVLTPHSINNLPTTIIQCLPYVTVVSNPVPDPDDPSSFICINTVNMQATDRKASTKFYINIENNIAHSLVANEYSLEGFYNDNNTAPPSLDPKHTITFTYTANALIGVNFVNYQLEYIPSPGCKLTYGWLNGGCYANAQANDKSVQCTAAAYQDKNTGTCRVDLKLN